MSREYSLTTMFYQTRAASLERFFQRAYVPGDFNFGTYTRGRADALRRALRRCPPDIQSRLGGHIRDISHSAILTAPHSSSSSLS